MNRTSLQVQEWLSRAIQQHPDEPWGTRLPWEDPVFSRRFVRVTDEQGYCLGPPEPDINRLMRIWLGHDQAGSLPRTLDLACGAGRHSVTLSWLGCDVTAVDISDVATARTETKAAKERGLGAIKAVTADIRDFTPEEPVQVALMLGAVSALFPPVELAAILRTVIDNLAPGGMAIVELPGELPGVDAQFYEPGTRPHLWSDWPCWEMHFRQVDMEARTVCDYYAYYVEVNDEIGVWSNWRLFYTAEWIAQMLPSRARMSLDIERGRRDWCIIRVADGESEQE